MRSRPMPAGGVAPVVGAADVDVPVAPPGAVAVELAPVVVVVALGRVVPEPVVGVGVVAVVSGAVVVASGTWGETVTTPRPKTEKRWAPRTTSAARNMASATLTGTRGLIAPPGSTTSPPSSSLTCETKRPPTTDENRGSPDPGPPGPVRVVPVQEHRTVAAMMTNTTTRTGFGGSCTGHSLPAARR
jgi:hypothetical protein